jgi:electron transport complex protein RnfB
VDCISLEIETGERTGWAAWSGSEASRARERYEFHTLRAARDEDDNSLRLEAKAKLKLADLPAHTHDAQGDELARKKAVIEAALARARQRAKP